LEEAVLEGIEQILLEVRGRQERGGRVGGHCSLR